MSIYKEPPPGMFVVPDPHDMTKVSISTLLPHIYSDISVLCSLGPSYYCYILCKQ